MFREEGEEDQEQVADEVRWSKAVERWDISSRLGGGGDGMRHGDEQTLFYRVNRRPTRIRNEGALHNG